MSEPLAFFLLDAEGRYEPSRFAKSAWSPSMLNGPAVVAAAARSLEVDFGDPDFLPARLTVDLFSAVRREPLTVRTSMVREGNRIRVADAEVIQGERQVARATLVQLRLSEQPPGQVWTSGRQVPVPPEVRQSPLGLGMRPLFGSDGAAEQWSTFMGDHQGATRKRFWQHPIDVVDCEPASPFQRAAMLSESTSLMTNWGSEGIGFINADITVAFSRMPTSNDLGIEADEHMSASGVSVGTATLYDREGVFATGTVVAVSNAQRQLDFSSQGLGHQTRPEQA